MAQVDAYTFPPDAPSVSPDPAHEEIYRAAIVAAVVAWEDLPKAAVPPRFSHGVYASPKNDSAHTVLAAMNLAIERQPVAIDGPARRKVVTLAARAGELAAAAGFGARGWAAFLAILQPPPRRAS